MSNQVRTSKKEMHELQESVDTIFGKNVYTIYAAGEWDATHKAYIHYRTRWTRSQCGTASDGVWLEFQNNTEAMFWMMDTICELEATFWMMDTICEFESHRRN